MVKSPVGPPGVPPVPTVGALLRGSLPGRKVCAVAADSRTMVASAAKGALLASLIAFLLRNEFNFCGRGRPCSPKSRDGPRAWRRFWPRPGDPVQGRARTLQLQA